jgi:nucleotide sugar dehydrogenase
LNFSRSNRTNQSIAPDGTVYSIPTERTQQTQFDELAQKAASQRELGRQIVVVQGLGFVGSAVAAVIAAARDGAGEPLYFVIGVDLASPSGYWKVAKLNEGLAPIVSPDPELPRLIHEAVCKTHNLYATVSEQAYALADVIVVDIQLDVRNRLADSAAEIKINLDSFGAAIHTIGRYMRPDALVLIETTVPAGTCEQLVLPILREERAPRGIDEPLLLAHAYERVMPGPNYINSIRHFWRTFSGIDEASTAKARDFLSSFIDTDSYPLWELEDTTSSELAKLLENSYRATNIAFIHEWTLLAERMGINLFAVIDSIRVRRGTHDNIRLPGFGVGGYCLTKDSLLAQWSANNWANQEVRLDMTLEALRINHRMPLHTLDLLKELAEGELTGKTIAVCGVAYLPEVADTRNSPTELLVDELFGAGAVVMVHDPYLTTWVERPDIPVTQALADCLRQADGIVFAVPHRAYRDLLANMIYQTSTASQPPLIVDAQNIISDEKAKVLHDAGCRLLGVGKGHWRKRGYQCQK